MGYYDEYLEHHGILGQKWGVRRFENKNGRLTAAGKARYDGDKVSKKEQRAAYNKRYDEWSSKQDANDAEFRRVQELRKGLGKTGLTRTINAARNKSDAAKEYNKAYDKWSSEQDKLDKEWQSVKASKPGLTDKQKKMIIAGAAVAGTALAAYGGYKLYQLNEKTTNAMAKRDHTEAGRLMDESLTNLKNSANSFNLADKTKIDVAKARNSGDAVSQRIYEKARTGFIENGSEYRRAANGASKKAGELAARAKAKNYSVGEKIDYLKSNKKGAAATNKLASEASSLARSVVAEGPKSFSKPAQNASQAKSQMTQQKLQSVSKTISSGSKSTSNVVKLNGQQKFSQASKANDDFVQELLKKNAKNLGL